jgi:glycosyltransferase involved in cell wall biosynthesis
MPDLVSIIIPVYNTASYLEICLQSVQKQTYKNIEVIIINDGSTDDSEQIIKRYIDKDRRFKYYSQSNKGLGYTRNKGIALSKGEYVFFLDSDDCIHENAISSLVLAIKQPEVDFAVGKVLRFNSERKYVPIRHLEFNLYNQNIVTTIQEHSELIQDSIACNKLWKKEFIFKHQLSFEVGKYYEDLFFTLKAAILAKKIAVIDKTVYYWRVRNEGESITQQQMKLKNTIDRLNALQKNQKWLIDHKVSSHVVAQHYLKSLIDVLRLHVLKYALIHIDDREEWKKRVYSFIKEIPKEIAEKLPSKEKILYELIVHENYEDLELFSKALTNTETEPIVELLENKLVIRGEKSFYDITAELKPVITVDSIHVGEGICTLSGRVEVPKASEQVQCSIIAMQRNNRRKINIGEPKLYVTENKSIYTFEKQSFQCKIKIKTFSLLESNQTFDLYLKIIDQHRPNARVRADSSLKKAYTFICEKKRVTLYRTNYGNISFKLEKKNGLKNIIKKVKAFFGKKKCISN